VILVFGMLSLPRLLNLAVMESNVSHPKTTALDIGYQSPELSTERATKP